MLDERQELRHPVGEAYSPGMRLHLDGAVASSSPTEGAIAENLMDLLNDGTVR